MKPVRRVVRVFESYTSRDGHVSYEWLWYLVGGGSSEGRFIGLCSEMTREDAEARVS